MAICPHCNGKVTLESANSDTRDELHKEVDGWVKKEVMYSCPYCDKVLGFALFFGGLTTGRP